MLRIVLDSNILVSAFITPHGEASEVYRQVASHSLFLSPFILSEVLNTLHASRLRKKYDYSDAEIEQYAQELISAADMADPASLPIVCSDPKDNAVLGCASEAQADYLVTRNTKHFPRAFGGVTVITPQEFLSLLRS